MSFTRNRLQGLRAKAASRNEAKDALDGLASPERILDSSCREAAQSNPGLN